jgi:hypothetical protein
LIHASSFFSDQPLGVGFYRNDRARFAVGIDLIGLDVSPCSAAYFGISFDSML